MININSGFNISGSPIDDRFVLTKDAMKNMSDSRMPDVYVALCEDDNNLYTYKKDNDVDPDTGKYKLYAVLDKKPPTIYGFHVDPSASEPVTYLADCDNANYTPASSNLSTGEFSYGSWKEDEFFMPRPCMLSYTGTVNYYLDPNNYNKKEDGTDSHVSIPFYSGNAMMEWGRDGKQIWYKVVPIGTGEAADIYISNEKVDDSYHAWNFIGLNKNNEYVLKDHFYTAIYLGTLSNGELHSLCADTTPQTRINFYDSLEYAKSITNNYSIDTFSDHCLINYLAMLMFKTTNITSVFGETRSSSIGSVVIGSGNTSGLFSKNTNKMFGMEYWFGGIHRWTVGLITDDSSYLFKYKMCLGKSDGSKMDEYASSESDAALNYILESEADARTHVTSWGYYASTMIYHDDGSCLPCEMVTNRSSSSNYDRPSADVKFDNTYVAKYGGAITHESHSIFMLSIDTLGDLASWSDLGATLSYR